MSRVLVSVEHISRAILVLRGHRVILDRDLAALYGVTTALLNEAVKRNLRRFPEDFMFRLSAAEQSALMSQKAQVQAPRQGHRRHALSDPATDATRTDLPSAIRTSESRW